MNKLRIKANNAKVAIEELISIERCYEILTKDQLEVLHTARAIANLLLAESNKGD